MSDSVTVRGTVVRMEVRDRVAWITLDGPDTRNALDYASATALVEACDAVDADRGIAAAVLTGAGSAFCSGADRSILADFHAQPADGIYDGLDALYGAFRRFGEMRVPTIAAINGSAVGAGLNLALAADVRVAAEDALLVPGFAENRIHPGGGHLHLLSLAAGRQAAAALGVLGQRISGTRAAEIGLVWRAVPGAELVEATADLTASVAQDPMLARALIASLRLTTAGGATTWPVAVEVERARQMWSMTRDRAG